MKVAIITNHPSPYRIPLYEKLAGKVDLTVYFTLINEDDKLWEIKFSDKFKYKILKSYNLKLKIHDVLNYHFNPSIINELIKNDYDIVVVGGYSSLTTQIAIFIAKLRRIPLIMWSGTTHSETSMVKNFFMPIIKFLVNRADGFIVYGTRAKNYLTSLGISPHKIFIATNVGNVDFFMSENEKLKGCEEELKKKFQISSKINILFVGRLIPIKGLKYLLDAFIKLKKDKKDVGIIILGDGPLKDKFLNKYGEEENIYFKGFIQPEYLPLYYKVANVYARPSSNEPFSIAISEAMASKLPIITTDKDGASDDIVIDGYNGYVVKEKSSDEVYKALKKLIQDENWLLFGANSKKLIENQFNMDNYAKGFVNAFNYVIDNKK